MKDDVLPSASRKDEGWWMDLRSYGFTEVNDVRWLMEDGRCVAFGKLDGRGKMELRNYGVTELRKLMG